MTDRSAAPSADTVSADRPHGTAVARIAERLVALFEPTSCYDAGCGQGLLVQAMAELGVDAHGGDVSEQAIEGAVAGVADRLEVRDLRQPFTERYDLISCIDVLGHLSAADAREAVVNLCGATDLIVMSATPAEFADPTGPSARQQSAWAQDFAARGFFRRTDIDASFVAPWAVIYQRSAPTAVQLVGAYESMVAPLTQEVVAQRRALVEALARTEALGHADLDTERMNRLAMADELIGTRAELALVKIQAENSVVAAAQDAMRLREVLAATETDLESARAHVAGLEREVSRLRASTTWRIGRALMAPVRLVRLPLRLGRRVLARVERILTR